MIYKFLQQKEIQFFKKNVFLKLMTLVAVICVYGACAYTIKIKDGRTAHERHQFSTAIPLLQSEFVRAKSRKDKGQLAYLTADAYARIGGQDENALTWYERAVQFNFGPNAQKGYAHSLKKLEKYKEASEAFKNLGIEIGSPYEYRKEITACKVAEDWNKIAPASGWKITQTDFNSSQNDYAPVVFSDKRLVFSSDRNTSKGTVPYRWTGNHFMDLMVVGIEEASAQSFDNLINTPGNEGSACFNANFTELFFSRAVGAYKGDDAHCKIFTAQRDGDGNWSNTKPLPFLKEKINYQHPALSPDGNTLIFSANDPEGWGGYDLYMVKKDAKVESGWETPQILSRAINTPENEMFPVFDGDTLYFASNGLTGMGGLDIFKTYRLEGKNWAPPANLKAPINSGADDFGLCVYKTEEKIATKQVYKSGDLLKSGFFSSNRSGGKGGDDIYRFEQRVPPPSPVIVKLDTTPKAPAVVEYKLLLEGYVLEKIFTIAGEPNSGVLGRKPLPNAIVTIDIAGKKQKITIGDDGFFKLTMTTNTDYLFTANLENYLANSTKFSTKGIAQDIKSPVQTFEVEIVLDRIFRNKEIVLDNIYYDYDKWDIRPDAEPTLNRLAEVLVQNPSIRISLGSHTDCRGNDGYNQGLSQKRAESAVNYLIGKGLDPSRLGAIGYGETQPTSFCNCNKCTESEHQSNRRTTFQILE
jgi:peptidoglycan-associated lipoprotein